MFKCNDCNEIFEEEQAREIRTSYESYYGVANDFPSRTPLTYMVCPNCLGEDFEEYEEEERED